MEFRQDCLLHRQVFYCSTGQLLLFGILILDGRPLQDLPLLCLGLFLLLLVPLIWCACPGNRIIADAHGIRCRSKNTTLWSYAWQEIRVLRCGRRNRFPIITVVPFEPPVQDLHIPQSAPRLYFQAGRTVRKTIQEICKCPYEQEGGIR